MMLSGRLEDWSVGDLLHMLRVTGKTASLAVAGDGRSGVVHFDGGRIVDADLTGPPLPDDPRSRVIETIYVLHAMTEGEFAIAPAGFVSGDAGLDVSDVLAVATERLALEEGLRDGGYLEAAGLGLVPAPAGPATIDPAEWEVLGGLVSVFSFADLEERFGRSRAVAFLAALDRLGLVETRRDAPVIPLVVPEEPAPPVAPPAAPPAGPSPWTVPDWDGEEPGPAPDPAGSRPAAAEEDGARRREMRAVISPADTTLVPGVLSDIRQRFRAADGRPTT